MTSEEYEARIARLQKALDVVTDLGVYPVSWEGKFEKRTDFMEGWNAHAMKSLEALQGVLEDGDWK